MKDPLSQLLRAADASALPERRPAGEIARSVRRRRRREQIRTRLAAVACVMIGVLALGLSLRPRDRAVELVAKRPATPVTVPKAELARLDVDARLAELTAQRLIADESRHRAPPAAAAVNIQEQLDRAALVLIYEGDGYARDQHSTEAVAAWQRAIALFPQSRWADVARQRLKELST